MHRADMSEYELHALVDCQLANERRGDVIAYLAAHPFAAKRVAAFARQRAALAALGQDMARTGCGNAGHRT
jgi:anti-sigma factor RsiW